jgi:peptide/nickel transport system permease protein
MLEVASSDFIVTARSKGMPPSRILYVHTLKNALRPVITQIGFNLGYMVGGTALVETVFAWPGLGRLLYDSLLSRDNPVLLGILVFLSVSVIVGNLLADVAYAVIDPRVRYK